MNKNINQIIKKNQYRSDFYKTYKKPHTTKRAVTPSKLTSSDTTHVKMTFYVKWFYQLLTAIIFLLMGMIIKNDPKLVEVNQLVFGHMNMKQIDSFVMNKIGGVFPQSKKSDLSVSLPVINMSTSQPFENGLIVSTGLYEGVTSQIDGMVIQILTENHVGKLIRIQTETGQIYEYGMLDDIKVSLYQRIDKGDLLGMSKTSADYESGEFYLAIKDGSGYLDVLSVIEDED